MHQIYFVTVRLCLESDVIYNPSYKVHTWVWKSLICLKQSVRMSARLSYILVFHFPCVQCR